MKDSKRGRASWARLYEMLGKMHQLCKEEKGIFTVEAALVSAFFLLIITAWMSLIQLAHLESLVRFSIDQMALQLSDTLTMSTLFVEGDQIQSYFEEMGWAESIDAQTASFGLEDIGLEAMFGKVSRQVHAEQLIQKHTQNRRWSFFWDDDTFTIQMDYELRYPSILGWMPAKPIMEQVTTGIWFDQMDAEASKEESKSASIWKEHPFRRGRYFADQFRRGKGTALMPGRGFDEWREPDQLWQSASLNPFSASYATREEDKYLLDREALMRQIQALVRKMKKDDEKYEEYTAQDGSIIHCTASHTLHLHLYLPEEAEQYATLWDEIAQQIAKEEGVYIEYGYEQKALIP